MTEPCIYLIGYAGSERTVVIAVPNAVRVEIIGQNIVTETACGMVVTQASINIVMTKIGAWNVVAQAARGNIMAKIARWSVPIRVKGKYAGIVATMVAS